MKKFLLGLISSVTILTSSFVCADVLGGGDDRYIGFQISIPLESNSGGLFSGKAEYSALLIVQNDGFKEGIAFTQDRYGNQTIGYLRPSHNFYINRSKISDYTIPIVTSNEAGVSQVGLVGAVIVVAVGVAVVGKALADEVDELVQCIVHHSESTCAEND
jgi:hypothetical protein